MNWAAILLAVAGVVGVLVTAAIVAVVVLLVRTERLVKSAVPRLAALPCPACGVAIGPATAAAVEAARKAEGQRLWEEAKQKRRETSPAGRSLLALPLPGLRRRAEVRSERLPGRFDQSVIMVTFRPCLILNFTYVRLVCS